MKRLHIDFVATPLWRLPLAARARRILLGIGALARRGSADTGGRCLACRSLPGGGGRRARRSSAS
jgi:hypothetical protein